MGLTLKLEASGKISPRCSSSCSSVLSFHKSKEELAGKIRQAARTGIVTNNVLNNVKVEGGKNFLLLKLTHLEHSEDQEHVDGEKLLAPIQ